ncbi:hypothetical protein V6N11_030728 [Hibiscus sabdariffa]|uniref:F-box domain-containing protein n=1 Tax=Hibiscus sabdariffa TaxID=183260 RepID=A0ABR2NBJ5_9ROSI
MCDYIPEDVVIRILKRLSVKSLVRFRSICKSWNSVICDPYFVSTHLQASLSNNTPFLLLRVTANPPNYAFDSKDMTFVNGAVHWLGRHAWIPRQMEALLYLNYQQMELHAKSYVESLVLLDKATNACSENGVNHPIDSRDWE